MKLTKRVKTIQSSATVEIADRVREPEARGEHILKLQTGEPHFPTPENIKLAAIDALHRDETHYSHSRGIRELRSLLCQRYNDLYCDGDLDPDKNVLVTPGAKQAILYAILSTIEDGDEVLIPSPAWVSYSEIVKISGGVPVAVGFKGEDRFRLSFQEIKESSTDRTRAIIFCSPNNPTGKIIDRTVLEDTYRFCVDQDIFLLADEIYDRIIFDGYEHHSIMDIDPRLQNCALVNGFSKTYAMTGWRIGYVISTQELIREMAKLQQQSATCLTTFGVYGAIEALKCGDKFPSKALKFYHANRDLLLEELGGSEYEPVEPEGGIYMLIDISSENPDSTEFCFDFLDRYKVAVTPGAAFGESSEGYIRICIANRRDCVAEFAKRLKNIGNRLSD